MFLLQFYLGGHDLIDIYHLKKNSIQGNRRFIRRSKLIDNAKDIILKYQSTNETNEYLFNFSYKGYDNFYEMFRRNILCIKRDLNIQIKPQDEPIGSKVARHSFCYYWNVCSLWKMF